MRRRTWITQSARTFKSVVANHQDFLAVFGKLSNRGAYKFADRARALRQELTGKNVYKLDIGSGFAPHPGNPKILYRDVAFKLTPYDFSDVRDV